MVGKSRNEVMEGMHEEPWGERYFPGLTEYEPEDGGGAVGVGMVERVARKVRKHPWQTMGVAAGVGALLGMTMGGSRCDCCAD